MDKIKNIIPRKLSEITFTEKLILVIALICQMIFMIYIPITFECDAATYYNYAKAFCFAKGAYVNFDRPPLYPLILFLSGTVFPGTFIFILFFQMCIGVINNLIFYKISKFFIREKFAFLGTLFFIISGISFVFAKAILAEQFFLFFMLLSIYYLVKCNFNFDKKNIFFFYLFTFITSFIRWEFLVFFILGSIFLLFKSKSKENYISLFKNISLFLITMFVYTLMKSIIMQNAGYIGSITERSGNQLFWRFFSQNQNVYYCEKNKISCDPVIQLENGGNIRKIYNIVFEELKSNPKIITNQKTSLAKEKYDVLYLPYENKPEELVNSMFKGEVTTRGHYWTLINTIIETKMGKIESNKLFKNVVFESLKKNKLALFDSLHKSFSFLNIHLYNFHALFVNDNKNILSIFRNLTSPYHYIDTGYNLGNCTKLHVSESMLKEYDFDRKIYLSLKNKEFFKKITSFTRNLIRLIFGCILIIISFLILFTKHKNKDLKILLISSFWGYILIVGIYGGGIYTKQEIFTIPLLVLIGMITIFQKKN